MLGVLTKRDSAASLCGRTLMFRPRSSAGIRRGGWNSFALRFFWLLFLIQGVSASEALRWRWSLPYPHGNNVVDTVWAAHWGLAVQVAERGQLYTSSDLELWLPRRSGTTKALRGVAFLGQRMVVTGEAGTVLYADAPEAIQAGTLLDGATADWLEAVAASASLAVAVGDHGAVYTTADGVSWKRQSSGTNVWLSGVAAGPNGFVAVGEGGCILSSGNGTNWVRRSNTRTNDLHRVRYADGAYTAVGAAGLVLVSSDGASWSRVTTGATRALQDTAREDMKRLVVGDAEVRLSLTGGLSWSDELARADGPPSWTYYTALKASNHFLIAGRSGMMTEAGPAGSGYDWVVRSTLLRNWLWDVVWVPNLFVAVGDRGTVLSSGNGVSWALEYPPLAFTNTVFLGVGGTTNLLVAVGSSGAVAYSPYALADVLTTNEFGIVITQQVSTLGIVWHEANPRPATHDLQGVCSHAGRMWICGDRGSVFSSDDGSQWTAHATPRTNFLSSICGFPGGLVASGDDGALVYSPDGTNWASVPSGTANWIYRVRERDGQLVAVGQNGLLMTSTNGTSWTFQTTGVTQWLNDAAWVGDRWWAIGTQGTVLSSTNLVDWTAVGCITGKSLYGAATDTQQLVVVGIEGIVLRSPIVPDQTPIEILSYAHEVSTNGTTVQNILLFGGHSDQQFTLDYTSTVETNRWTVGPQLEFYNASGTLYYFETMPLSNAPPVEFYRATLLP